MKKKFLCLIISVIAILSGFCTGCSNSNSSETSLALAVVAGIHNNAPDIPFNSLSLKTFLYDSCYTYGDVCIVRLDGDPKVYYQTNIPRPDTKNLTESKKKSIATNYTTQLLNEIANIKPMVSEVDTLKGINEGAKALSASPDTSDKIMLIADSGISTKSYLDFSKGLLNADTDKIVEALQQAEAIPDLRGIRVEWMFIGQTADPQPELSEGQKNKLKEIWRAVLVAGGAKEVRFLPDIATDSTHHDYPDVSIIDVEDRDINVEPQGVTIEEPIKTIVLDSTRVEFVGNKAIFTNMEEATANIKELADQLLAHPNNKVYVIGTTASGDKDFCQQLSVDRAKVVVEVLVSYGVPESQLVPIGLGYEDPWHKSDLDNAGKQIEEIASQNRKVLIMDVNGEEADKLNP